MITQRRAYEEKQQTTGLRNNIQIGTNDNTKKGLTNRSNRRQGTYK
jgi:hypothetical protein